MSIRVIIAGFKGRMGQAACQMVLSDSELELVAVLDPFESASEWQGTPVFNDKNDLAGFDAHVWVDFTTPAVAYENTRFALENGFAPVVGTTDFAFKVKRNGIETGVNMQVSAGEHIGPSGQVLILGEVEHGHDGLGAP